MIVGSVVNLVRDLEGAAEMLCREHMHTALNTAHTCTCMNSNGDMFTVNYCIYLDSPLYYHRQSLSVPSVALYLGWVCVCLQRKSTICMFQQG